MAAISRRPFTMRRAASALAMTLALAGPALGADDQSKLEITTNAEGPKTLAFDWPMLKIGTGEYQAGPTGVTVFAFGRKVLGAVDVRGGAPGTVETDFLRLGYDAPELDAVVFAGGSVYGLEGATAVSSAMKDDGLRNGHWENIAMSVGAIVYDLGPRRLNEIYPDKRLAQAAYRAARPGVFPQGAHGAGRMVRSGGFFACNAHSGQGGAFRQIGNLKIAAFTVVNAMGAVTDRDGKVVACYRDAGWPKDIKTVDLLNGVPDSRKPGWMVQGPQNERKNTTISLIVTNQTLKPAELQRLAVQVHTSMARGLQPFSTVSDGDVMYAVSTGELDAEKPELAGLDVATIASEVMWDAILNSVPEQAPVVPAAADPPAIPAATLARYAGDYTFSPETTLRVSVRDGKLFGAAVAGKAILVIPDATPVELKPVSATDFTVPGRYPMLLRFDGKDGLTINPGPWKQTATRAKAKP